MLNPQLKPEVIPPNPGGAIRLDVAECKYVTHMFEQRVSLLPAKVMATYQTRARW